MELNQKLIKNREHGDVSRIHLRTGISRQTISKAINSGKGSRRVINAIESYFKTIGHEKI